MKKKKGLTSATGTKSISLNDSPLFRALEERIEKEPSVQLWSFEIDKNVAIVTIHFNDGETFLDLRVNPYNISELKKAVETLDDYFLSKLERC